MFAACAIIGNNGTSTFTVTVIPLNLLRIVSNSAASTFDFNGGTLKAAVSDNLNAPGGFNRLLAGLAGGQ